MPKKAILHQYGLDFGQMIHADIKSSSLTFDEISYRMNLTLNGLKLKLKTPHFGNIYDLINVSILMKTNYIEFANSAVRAKGLPLDRLYNQIEFDQVNEALKKCEIEKNRYIAIVDKLNNQ